MKILFVSGIFPPDLGGPATYVPAMAEALGNLGHQIVGVVTLADDPDAPMDQRPFPVYRLARHQWRPLRLLRTIATIRRLARHADVVFLNGLVLEGVIASRLATRPTVIKVVGDLMWERARNQRATTLAIDAFQTAILPWRWRWLRRLQGVYTAAAARVLTPSRYLGGIVAQWGVSPDRIRVVYNAVEAPPPTATTMPAAAWDVVTVARLVPWKGLAELIDLAKARDWHLKIVGDGPLRAELEARSRGANVTFTGQVPQSQVAHEIRSGRVFVLNSSYEGLPHIVLEAKAAGVPVVATAAGGTVETIHDGVDGFLVPPGDVTALADRIGHLLADESRHKQLAQAGLAQISGSFSYQRMVTQTLAVLREAAETPS